MWIFLVNGSIRRNLSSWTSALELYVRKDGGLHLADSADLAFERLGDIHREPCPAPPMIRVGCRLSRRHLKGEPWLTTPMTAIGMLCAKMDAMRTAVSPVLGHATDFCEAGKNVRRISYT